MAWTNSDLLAIKAELTNDPKTLGLTTSSADDESNANKLSAVFPTDPGYVKTLPVKRAMLPVRGIFNVVSVAEHTEMSPQQASYFSDLMLLGQINPAEDQNTTDALLAIFPENAAIAPLFTQPGTRITQLFQDGLLSHGGSVTPSDVSDARAAV